MLTYLGQLGVVTIMVLAQSGFLNESGSPMNLTYLADTVMAPLRGARRNPPGPYPAQRNFGVDLSHEKFTQR
jgi:hypothetical protein